MSFKQWRSFVLSFLFMGVLTTTIACGSSIAKTPANPINRLEQNKAIVTRLIEEALNKGNFNIVDEVIAENAIDNDAFPNQPTGREGFRFHFRTLKTAMPDLNVTFRLLVM